MMNEWIKNITKVKVIVKTVEVFMRVTKKSISLQCYVNDFDSIPLDIGYEIGKIERN